LHNEKAYEILKSYRHNREKLTSILDSIGFDVAEPLESPDKLMVGLVLTKKQKTPSSSDSVSM
jgi:hypothetical protein